MLVSLQTLCVFVWVSMNICAYSLESRSVETQASPFVLTTDCNVHVQNHHFKSDLSHSPAKQKKTNVKLHYVQQQINIKIVIILTHTRTLYILVYILYSTHMHTYCKHTDIYVYKDKYTHVFIYFIYVYVWMYIVLQYFNMAVVYLLYSV